MTWRTQENTVVFWVPSHRNCICSLTWFKCPFLPFVFHFVPQLYQPSRPGPLWFISSQWCPDSVLQDIWPGNEIFPQGWVFGWWCIEFGCQSHPFPGWVHGKRVGRADDKSLPPQLSWKEFCHHWRSAVSLLWCHREGGQVSCTSHQSDRSQFPFPQGNRSFFCCVKAAHHFTASPKGGGSKHPCFLFWSKKNWYPQHWQLQVPLQLLLAEIFQAETLILREVDYGSVFH